MKKIIVPILAALLCGCATTGTRAPLPPEFYEVGTATALSYGLRNSPQTANYLRAVQPVACALATGNHLTPAEVEAALTPVAGHTPEGLLLVRSVELLYIAAFNSVGGQTNAAAAKPYADAVFCLGFQEGLNGAPSLARARRTSKWKWPVTPMP